MKHNKKLWLMGCLMAALPVCAQGPYTTAWNEFATNSKDNVLLDFSYAGYNHGLSLPPESYPGYTVYNVMDYGAVPNDGKSDRQALEKVIKKIGYNVKAHAIIYFPEGEFILHSEEDDVIDAATNKKKSVRINLAANDVILKGAGRDKTFLTMTAPMLPADEKILYSSPSMLGLLNYGTKTPKSYATVVGAAAKNTFKVKVDDTSKLTVGQWVRLYMKPNKDPLVIKEELQGRTPETTMTNLTQSGVTVVDYHQIKAISGNEVTFEEPIMHAVKPSDGWELTEYRHYEGLGVEDVTFRGKANPHFKHHGSWNDDGGYNILDFIRLVNSWLRRVSFESVSGCATFQDCANVVCYDVEITGNRGHSAVRMASSSRGLIANVYDHSDGYMTSDKNFKDHRVGLGQFHACGVSKPSIGNVIWNCQWGSDACFESHATQPRATLFDCCKGGFMQLRMGGSLSQMPNHLDDLTIWNFECTTTNPQDFPFSWWETVRSIWYKSLPPTVVGFHGAHIPFVTDQMKRNEAQGQAVNPRSLYVAQLEKRLGRIPDWIKSWMANVQTAKTTWDFTVMSTEDNTLFEQDTNWNKGQDAGRNYYINQQALGVSSGSKKILPKDIKKYTTPISVNGKEPECTKRLRFGVYVNDVCKILGPGKLMLCCDEGYRVLRLNANAIAILIPDCKKGQQIIIHSKSASSQDARYLKAVSNLDIVEGFAAPDDPSLVQESIGKVKADGDVLLTTVNGNFLYDIIVKDASGNVVTTGLTELICEHRTPKIDAIYNLQGQQVGTTYKGIVIKNGKKIIQQ